MNKSFIFFSTVILLLGLVNFAEAQGDVCPTTVYATTIGPPTWEYVYDGSGGMFGSMYSFTLEGVSCYESVTPAPGYIPDLTIPNTILFYTFAGAPCGSVVSGFSVYAPLAMNGTVNWQDPVGGTSGVTDGPVCIPTPTNTPTPFGAPTHTPSPTPSAPTPTPTVGPYLELVTAGPPTWTYRWWGSTDGFLIRVPCTMPDGVPNPDWECNVVPGEPFLYICWNRNTPDPTFRMYEPFSFTSAPAGAAQNSTTVYQVVPIGVDIPIEGPACAPPTSTPTPIGAPTNTPTTTSTNTASPTNTPVPTNTPIPTSTFTPTNTSAFTNTPTATNTSAFTNTPTPTTSFVIPISGNTNILISLLLVVFITALVFRQFYTG